MFENMAKVDMINQFVTYVASSLYEIPAGPAPSEYIRERLFTRG